MIYYVNGTDFVVQGSKFMIGKSYSHLGGYFYLKIGKKVFGHFWLKKRY